MLDCKGARPNRDRQECTAIRHHRRTLQSRDQARVDPGPISSRTPQGPPFSTSRSGRRSFQTRHWILSSSSLFLFLLCWNYATGVRVVRVAGSVRRFKLDRNGGREARPPERPLLSRSRTTDTDKDTDGTGLVESKQASTTFQTCLVASQSHRRCAALGVANW